MSAFLQECGLSTSKSLLYFAFGSSVSGVRATLTGAPAVDPTVHSTGFTGQLASGLWQNDQNTLVYLLPSGISFTASNMTVTAPANWVTTVQGSIGSGLYQVVDFSNPVDITNANMRIGWNAPSINFYNLPVYTNWLKHAQINYGAGTSFNTDDNGYFSNLVPGTTGIQMGIAPTAPYDAFATTYTLSWRGSGTNFTMDNKSYPIISGPVNTMTGPLSAAWTIKIRDTNFTDMRLYVSGVDQTAMFTDSIISKIKDASVIRFMDPLNVNQNNILDFDHWHRSTDLNFNGTVASSTRNGNIIGVNGSTNVSGWLELSSSPWTPIKFMTDIPHGLLVGQNVTVNLFNYPITTSGYVHTSNATGAMYVLDDHTFLGKVYIGNGLGQFTTMGSGLDHTITPCSGLWSVDAGPSMPLMDCISMCNQVGADLWMNFPSLFDNNSCAKAFATIASGLSPNLKVWAEYNNEHWNIAGPFQGSDYCYGQGAVVGLSSDQWYTKRTGEIHAVGSGVFALVGRPASDIVKVFGSWSAGTQITTSIAAYASGHNIPVDYVAIAPYMRIQPQSGPGAYGAVMDLFGIEQVMDLSEINVKYDSVNYQMASHDTILKQYLPNASMVCYEGGPDYGGLPSATGVVDQVARSHSWCTHPRMRGIYQGYIQSLQRLNCKVYVDYALLNYANTSQGFAWWKYLRNTQLPGLGDGSDGLFNNLTDLTGPNTVSVMGKAHQDWFYKIQPGSSIKIKATPYLKNQIRDYLYRSQSSFPKPSGLSLGLAHNLSGGAFNEISAADYSRIPLNPSDAFWGTTSVSGQTYNKTTLNFPMALTNWGAASGIVIFDTVVSGNPLYVGSMNRQSFINRKDIFSIPPSGLMVTWG